LKNGRICDSSLEDGIVSDWCADWETAVYFGHEDVEFGETMYVIVAKSDTLSISHASIDNGNFDQN
jgi:hypothetical protein